MKTYQYTITLVTSAETEQEAWDDFFAMLSEPSCVEEGTTMICLSDGEVPEGAECDECGREDVVGSVDGTYYFCTRHEAKVRAIAAKEQEPSDDAQGKWLHEKDMNS